MKRIYILSAAALMVAAAGSCRKEEPQVRPDSGDADFYASIEGTDTRTSVAADGTVQWCEGDKISVNGGVYVVSGISSPTSASFVHESGPSAEAPFYAFYPYTIQSRDSIGVLPSVWDYDPKSPSVLPMYAYSENNTLKFRNVCAALKVSVNRDTVVTSIKVSASKDLSGRFIVYNGDSLAISDTTHPKTFELNCGEGVYGTDFYLPIPAGKYHSLTVTLNTETSSYDLISTNRGDTVDMVFENNTIYPVDFMCRNARAEADAVYAAFAANLLSAGSNGYSPFFAAFNLCGDDVMVPNYDGQTDLFEFNTLTYDTENEVVSSALDGIISTINETNKFLDYWDKRSSKSGETKACIAEMRTLRAYLHYLMGVAWNNAPKIDSVLTASYAKKLVNKPRKELLEWCAGECFTAAEGGLKPEGDAIITKNFAYAILGKIYLYMGNKREAEQAFSVVINSKMYELWQQDFGKLFHFQSEEFYKSECKEYIFRVKCPSSADELAFFDWRTPAFRMDPAALYTGNLQGSGFVGVRQGHCDSILLAGDKRCDFSFVGISDAVNCNKEGLRYITGKVDPAAIGIRAEGMKGQSLKLPFKSLSQSQDIGNRRFTVMRYAEIILLKLEAVTMGQMELFNQLRARAGAPTVSSYDPKYLYAECDREMFLEGQRWINQVRWADQSGTKALEANRVISTLYDTLTRKPAKDEKVIWENGTQNKSRFYIVTDTIKTPELSTKYYHFPYPEWFLDMFPNCKQDELWSE